MPLNQTTVDHTGDMVHTPVNDDDYPVSSEAVQEIISARPGYLVRSGTILIFLILIAITGGMWFIRYPDTLEGAAVVTTNPLPIRLKTVSGGRLLHLFVADNTSVAASTPIAELQNSTGYENIHAIETTSERALSALQSDNIPALKSLLALPAISLGEAQASYNALLQSISSLVLLKEEHIYARRTGNLQAQINRYHSAVAITATETGLTKQELAEAAERFAANEKLYREKVISRQEYQDEAARLRQKQLSLQSQYKEAVQQDITAGSNNRQLLDIEYEKAEKERSSRLAVEEAIRNLQAFIQSWKLQFMIVAPYSGTVHYLRPLQLNEGTGINEELFAVTPQQYRYEAHVAMPAAGLGKVRAGQKAHLLLAQFPYNEYGYLEGVVNSVSTLPIGTTAGSVNGSAGASGQTMYRVIIQLPQSLITSYHKQLLYTPEMSGQARIITKDRNLLQRLAGAMAGINK